MTLCARDPQLREFAFVLADNGHTHIGHVLSLHRCTLVDMADGQDWLADAILDHIERSNAQAGFSTDGWAPPPADTIDAALD